ALNAATMPRCIFWPSSLVGPLIAAEIPNRISLSVTPRKVLRGAGEFGESAACCVCAGVGGTCCACALTDGSALEPAGAGMSLLFACGLFGEIRSDRLEACGVRESSFAGAPAHCHRGLAKITTMRPQPQLRPP